MLQYSAECLVSIK